jgi:quercetin dioxygenase-like cupin family protein
LAVSTQAFKIIPVADKTVDALPKQPLYWHVQIFGDADKARAAAGPLSLPVDASGKSWLFTLSAKGSYPAGGQLLSEIGPVPVVSAKKYLLRINHAQASPGSATPVHTHPGSEAFHVITGTLCQKTSHGDSRLEAGQSMNGHAPGMVMQLTNCGTDELDQLVMFVVDAEKPFSTPAAF